MSFGPVLQAGDYSILDDAVPRCRSFFVRVLQMWHPAPDTGLRYGQS
jgi:hypothetical protein